MSFNINFWTELQQLLPAIKRNTLPPFPLGYFFAYLPPTLKIPLFFSATNLFIQKSSHCITERKQASLAWLVYGRKKILPHFSPQEVTIIFKYCVLTLLHFTWVQTELHEEVTELMHLLSFSPRTKYKTFFAFYYLKYLTCFFYF